MTFLLVKGMIQSNDKFLINIKQNLININRSGSLATDWLKRLGFKRGQNISDEFKFTIKASEAFVASVTSGKFQISIIEITEV